MSCCPPIQPFTRLVQTTREKKILARFPTSLQRCLGVPSIETELVEREGPTPVVAFDAYCQYPLNTVDERGSRVLAEVLIQLLVELPCYNSTLVFLTSCCQQAPLPWHSSFLVNNLYSSVHIFLIGISFWVQIPLSNRQPIYRHEYNINLNHLT